MKIKKEWIKYLPLLENIDAKITNEDVGVCWYAKMKYEAKKAGIPEALIKEYVDGDLVVINGIPYDLHGKRVEIA